MRTSTTPSIDAMFHQAASTPLSHLPPLEYLLTRLPRHYPLFPLAAFDPTFKASSVPHTLYREQRNYSPTTHRTHHALPTKTTKPIPYSIQLLAEIHRTGTLASKGKDDTALFDFLASVLPPTAPDELIDAWTAYFQQHPSENRFDTALLFILKLRIAYTKSLVNFEKDYANRLQTSFAPIGTLNCSLSWDRHTEYRVWTLSGPEPLTISPHPRIPNSIRIQTPNLFFRPTASLYDELTGPPQDQLLLQCEHLANTNGFTTY